MHLFIDASASCRAGAPALAPLSGPGLVRAADRHGTRRVASG